MRHCPLAVICLAASFALWGCSREEAKPVQQNKGVQAKPAETMPSIQVGGVYATQDADGSWRVVKVLALEEGIVHLRSYANKFGQQPTEADLPKLTLGRVGDPGGFGIGHFPLAREGFEREKRVLIKVEPVREDELEGYKLYLEAMKGPG